MLQMKVRYSDYFTVERTTGTATVRFEGCSALDTSVSEGLATDLYALVDVHGIVNMVLDLAGVRFLSSRTLGTLVGLQRKARAAGGGILLAGVEANIARMLRVTRLDSLLTVQEQPDLAVEPEGPGGCALAMAGGRWTERTSSPATGLDVTPDDLSPVP